MAPHFPPIRKTEVRFLSAYRERYLYFSLWTSIKLETFSVIRPIRKRPRRFPPEDHTDQRKQPMVDE